MNNYNFKLDNKKTFIVAEIGNNHEGSFNLAKKLIDKAKDCGVDEANFKFTFQSYFIQMTLMKRIRQLKKFSLSFNQFINLQFIQKDLIFFHAIRLWKC